MKFTGKIILFAGLTLPLGACLKVKDYPDVPQIKVLNAYIDPFDSTAAYVNFQFNDGDGDIGLEQGDTLPPYNFGSEFYNNLYVEYLEKQNGVWVKTDDLLSRIPSITPKGKVKTLEGEIQLKTFVKVTSPNDTFMYALTLIDRSLHKSNRSETGVLIK